MHSHATLAQPSSPRSARLMLDSSRSRPPPLRMPLDGITARGGEGRDWGVSIASDRAGLGELGRTAGAGLANAPNSDERAAPVARAVLGRAGPRSQAPNSGERAALVAPRRPWASGRRWSTRRLGERRHRTPTRPIRKALVARAASALGAEPALAPTALCRPGASARGGPRDWLKSSINGGRRRRAGRPPPRDRAAPGVHAAHTLVIR